MGIHDDPGHGANRVRDKRLETPYYRLSFSHPARKRAEAEARNKKGVSR